MPNQSIIILVKVAIINSSKMYIAEIRFLYFKLNQLSIFKPSQVLSKTNINTIELIQSIYKLVIVSSKLVKQYTSSKILILARKYLDAIIATPIQSDLFANKSFFIKAIYDNLELSKDKIVVLIYKNSNSIFYNYYKLDYIISYRVTQPILLYIQGGNNNIIYLKQLVKYNQQQYIIDLYKGYYIYYNISISTKDNYSSNNNKDNNFFKLIISIRQLQYISIV